MEQLNDYIRYTLSKEADMLFDCVPYLQKSDKEPHMAKYEGHPVEEGCKIWGEKLGAALNGFLKKL